MSDQWFFAEAGRQIGPVAFSYVARLSEHQPDILVWRPGLDAWSSARSLKEFAEFVKNAPPSLPESALVRPVEPNSAELQPTQSVVVEPEQAIRDRPVPRPWRRFWARMFDSLLAFYFLVGLLGVMGAFHHTDWFQALCWVSVIMLMWVPLEALFTTVFGRTFGKMLHGVAYAEWLPPNEAVKRALSVWFRGMSAGFPPTAWAAWVVAADTLNKTRITSWDRSLGIMVVYKPFAAWRSLLAFITWLTFIGFPTLFYLNVLADLTKPDLGFH